MKGLLFLSTLLFTVLIINTALAQELRVVTLDETDLADGVPIKIVLFPGDTLQFRAVNGDFTIYIKDAFNFLRIREDNLKIRVDSAGEALSDFYEVRTVESNIDKTFSIYCISSDTWPDAPPRIIIVSE